MERIQFVGHGGQVVGSGQFGNFRLTETRYTPGYLIPKHAHELPCFCIVLRGGYREKFDDLTIECERNTVIFRPGGEPHDDRVGAAGAHCLLIEPNRLWTDGLDTYPVLPQHPWRWAGPVVPIGLNLYREFRFGDDLSSVIIEGLALELATVGMRLTRLRTPSRPKWLVHATDILHSSFSEAISLSSVASQVGVHPVSLARAFRQHFGCTLGEYVRRLRIAYVCDRMLDSENSLTEIAFAAGFSHQAHLCKTFKRQMGMSPSQFRILRRSR